MAVVILIHPGHVKVLLIPIFQQASSKAGLDECLFFNQFFAFQQEKNWLWTRKTGSTVAATPCWSWTKNRLALDSSRT